jgi:hypothetical protein
MAQTVAALDSPLSLWRRLCAWVPPSLRRVSGSGCVLRFCRVCAESLARVACLSSADSSPSLWSQPRSILLFTIKPCVATGDNVLPEFGV